MYMFINIFYVNIFLYYFFILFYYFLKFLHKKYNISFFLRCLLPFLIILNIILTFFAIILSNYWFTYYIFYTLFYVRLIFIFFFLLFALYKILLLKYNINIFNNPILTELWFPVNYFYTTITTLTIYNENCYYDAAMPKWYMDSTAFWRYKYTPWMYMSLLLCFTFESITEKMILPVHSKGIFLFFIFFALLYNTIVVYFYYTKEACTWIWIKKSNNLWVFI